MAKITIFNLGNADCSRMDLEDDQKILVDYAATRDDSDDEDKRVDLPALLKEDLESEDRDYFDVVAFTHLDRDHIQGSTEFFWLEHAKKYQSDDRIRIRDLWVPAALITEEGQQNEARILQDEARHRLKEGKGVRVFSRPERLKDWLEDQGLSLDQRSHLITDAGKLVPGYSKDGEEGVEFFIHSPHAVRQDENTVEDRNGDCLVFQARFSVGGYDTDVLFTGDAKHQTWIDVVNITRSKGNDDRLRWNVYKLPHHCSYTAIGPEKSTNQSPDSTPPVEQVAWLCEEQGANRGIIVSSSKPIPEKGSDEDKDDQPPHREAANYYKDAVLSKKDGEFLTTMEHPDRDDPQPIVIEIGQDGAAVSGAIGGFSIITSTESPRAGWR